MKTCICCNKKKDLSLFEGNRKKCRKCRTNENTERSNTVGEPRICKSCHTLKDGTEFRGGLKTCIDCWGKKQKRRTRTKAGHIKKIYLNQKRASKIRGHNPPTYSVVELTEWLMSQKKFHIFYDNWKRLDYQKWYAPSVDRKNDSIGYTLSNIQLMTWQENKDKAHEDSKTNKLQTGNKKTPVCMYALTGEYLATFASVRAAARSLGKNAHKDIAKCCKGVNNYCGGYKWKYLTNDGGSV